MTNAEAVKRQLEHGKTANALQQPGRALEAMSIRPGFSIYLGGVSYADSTLHIQRYKRLKMWDIGSCCLLQALDAEGNVIDEAELMWHAVWWRKVVK